ncbi:MAG: UDP-3-O-acyl-N-acetylglucosamine deacetylase [Tannerella sp.]|jgi:UDP-3-O-[3-hydroxymyristoyl] N-acetylglucosamine deacetylase/3-hydroxyacyl-[acyl-carrier-protein] dehydratase|nr:UDP-3-O-acyl-N-acetylglucosamine deacetylase [Tannerella sp.]
MEKQRTLNKEFSLEGKGLHTGLDIHITFRPAPVNSGYRIRRIDLPGKPVIRANAENVCSTERGTVLSVDGVQVSTVEHALAALYASGIDNCLMDVDAPEFPILDGSSILFMDKIVQTGIKEQSEERVYYMAEEVIEYVDEASGSHLILLPADEFKVQCQISFDSAVLNVQSAHLNDLSDFHKEIAMCRTFVFVHEVKPLLKKGLIKGGDLDNAIVIYDRKLKQDEFDSLADAMNVERRDADRLGYIMNLPLRYTNEPARHKIIDVIGDLALTGRFIKGIVIAICPGHRVNNQFARAIMDDMKKHHQLPVKEMVEYSVS